MKLTQSKVLTCLGRLLFAIPMVFFGVQHFTNGTLMIGAVPTYIPGGIFWVYFTGAALILAGLSIVIRKFDQLATFLLGIMLLIFVLTIHLPGVLNPATMSASLPGFVTDIALVGAAFYMSGSILATKK